MPKPVVTSDDGHIFKGYPYAGRLGELYLKIKERVDLPSAKIINSELDRIYNDVETHKDDERTLDSIDLVTNLLGETHPNVEQLEIVRKELLTKYDIDDIRVGREIVVSNLKAPARYSRSRYHHFEPIEGVMVYVKNGPVPDGTKVYIYKERRHGEGFDARVLTEEEKKNMNIGVGDVIKAVGVQEPKGWGKFDYSFALPAINGKKRIFIRNGLYVEDGDEVRIIEETQPGQFYTAEPVNIREQPPERISFLDEPVFERRIEEVVKKDADEGLVEKVEKATIELERFGREGGRILRLLNERDSSQINEIEGLKEKYLSFKQDVEGKLALKKDVDTFVFPGSVKTDYDNAHFLANALVICLNNIFKEDKKDDESVGFGGPTDMD
jgi:hypothetical protein